MRASLYFDAKTKKISALNGSGRAPQALNLAKARELGLKGRDIPFLDINSFVSSRRACDIKELTRMVA